jgi:hypothetical protein
MSNQPIKTSIGILSGRDAIYLDEIDSVYDKRTIVFVGEINASLASEYRGNAKWLKYKINFFGVDALRMTELDCYESEINLASSFDRVMVPTMKSRTMECKQFILATYDHIFEIMATDYEFEIIDERNAEQQH